MTNAQFTTATADLIAACELYADHFGQKPATHYHGIRWALQANMLMFEEYRRCRQIALMAGGNYGPQVQHIPS